MEGGQRWGTGMVGTGGGNGGSYEILLYFHGFYLFFMRFCIIFMGFICFYGV